MCWLTAPSALGSNDFVWRKIKIIYQSWIEQSHQVMVHEFKDEVEGTFLLSEVDGILIKITFVNDKADVFWFKSGLNNDLSIESKYFQMDIFYPVPWGKLEHSCKFTQ